MDGNRALIATGAVGAALAAICCAAPILVIGLASIGFAGMVGSFDWVLITAFVACIGLIGFGLYRRKCDADACRTASPATKAEKIS
jgi:mercuric ion transport protein